MTPHDIRQVAKEKLQKWKKADFVDISGSPVCPNIGLPLTGSTNAPPQAV